MVSSKRWKWLNKGSTRNLFDAEIEIVYIFAAFSVDTPSYQEISDRSIWDNPDLFTEFLDGKQEFEEETTWIVDFDKDKEVWMTFPENANLFVVCL